MLVFISMTIVCSKRVGSGSSFFAFFIHVFDYLILNQKKHDYHIRDFLINLNEKDKNRIP